MRIARGLWPAFAGAGEVEAWPSFYSACISTFETICLASGIGIAIGMVAGTTGLEGSARGRMVILAAVIAAVIGFFVTDIIGTVFAAFFAGLACAVASGIIAGATRRGGTAALGFLLIFAALVVVIISIPFSHLLALIPMIGLIWLALSRRRRAQDKHAGLRVLR
jgi:hypothetical protein